MTVALPLMARGMWSTYCGLMSALMLSSSTLVKKFCSSDPRKYLRILCVGRVVVSTQVGLLLAREDLERGRLADTVGADETQHLACAWCGESMQLEELALYLWVVRSRGWWGA